jgi:tRNA(adenine34) deaminase
MDKDEFFMKKALDQAQKAFDKGEFPVGCVIADGLSVVAEGCRSGSAGSHPNEIDHAEIITIRRLFERVRQADETELTIYCTMEPCLMCFGAIVLAGIRRIVYAYEDVMGGGTGCRLESLPPLYPDAGMTIVGHVLREPSLKLFKAFFAKPDNSYWKGSLLAEYTLAQNEV